MANPRDGRNRPGRSRYGVILALIAIGGALDGARAQAQAPDDAACAPSLFLAGDTVLTQPWSGDRAPAFLGLVETIRAADLAIVNLETLIHTYKGYAQANSGGTWMASPPAIADELAWAGIDAVVTANNHAFDYGAIGVLENLEHLARAGLAAAGTGEDLQAARRPVVLDYPGGRLALLAAASSFVPYGRASMARPDMRGRPGLNPLAVRSDLQLDITPAMARALRALTVLWNSSGDAFARPRFRWLGVEFQIAERFAVNAGARLSRADRAANLAAVAAADRAADIVVLSLHARQQDEWLAAFARDAFAAGADIVFVHGPHQVRGIAVHDGRPIFYGLGDFAFEIDQIARLPSDQYEGLGLPHDAPREAFRRARYGDGTRSHAVNRKAFQSVGARVCFRDGRVAAIRLVPLDLRFHLPLSRRGRPMLADRELGRAIIADVRRHSADFGTAIDYDDANNVGHVRLPGR